ncbi:hypothetical protein F4803DRAFT_553939 [Xylaria telfairii]|nr:hypothetical protein F4803DRAFT_553939 [Xylaria telfairii]
MPSLLLENTWILTPRSLNALHYKTLQTRPEYEALAYTWGEKGTREVIVIDGRHCSSFENLEATLRRLRLRNKSRKLWVNALCIDQADVYERSQPLLPPIPEFQIGASGVNGTQNYSKTLRTPVSSRPRETALPSPGKHPGQKLGFLTVSGVDFDTIERLSEACHPSLRTPPLCRNKILELWEEVADPQRSDYPYQGFSLRGEHIKAIMRRYATGRPKKEEDTYWEWVLAEVASSIYGYFLPIFA